MKQPVAFQNSPDVIFAGWLAYLGAIAAWTLSILLLSLGYPEWITIGSLFLASLASAVLSRHFLSRSFGRLHIGPQGMEYFPIRGAKASFPWQELAQIKVLPGWLRIYDKQGKKIFSYTYGLGKQHALINVIAQQMGNRRLRPTIWPEVASGSARVPKKTPRNHIKCESAALRRGVQKTKKTRTLKITQAHLTGCASADQDKKPRPRKRTAASTTQRSGQNSPRRQS